MQQPNTELAESLHQFVTIWKLIGRPFPQVDQTHKGGLAITWPDIAFPFYNALSNESWMTQRYGISHDSIVFRTMCRSRRVSPW
jgi:hypothetical protein